MYKSKILSLLLSFLFVLIFSFSSPAAFTDPGDPGSEPGDDDDPLGGGAPIGGGMIVLITLGLGYGGKKVYDLRNKDLWSNKK